MNRFCQRARPSLLDDETVVFVRGIDITGSFLRHSPGAGSLLTVGVP